MEVVNLTFEQAKIIDQRTIEKGVPEKILMGLASQSACITLQHLNLLKDSYFYIFLCGSGNNGGDGFALAYLMISSLYVKPNQIKVFYNPPKTESSQFYFDLLKQTVILHPLEEFLGNTFKQEELFLYKHIIFIEALLGSGQKDLPKEPISHILKKIQLYKQQFPITHIAMDIPAGLSEEYMNLNSNEFLNFFDLPIPDLIFSFGLPKLALSIHPKIHAKATIYHLPCGFDPVVQNEVINSSTKFLNLEKTDNFSFLLKEKFDHKYSSGYGWLFSGSKNLEGASLLASKAFFYSGGGILHLIHFSSEKEIFLNSDPSIIFRTIDIFIDQYRYLKLPNCIAIGSGVLPKDIETYKDFFIKFFQYLSQQQNVPIIILDAYATKFILDQEYPETLRKYTILTPHIGEWKELGGAFPYLVKNWQSILEFHHQLRCSILIKGSISFFLPYPFENYKNKVFLWKYQNQHLAVAGSGDVLVGLFLRIFSKLNSNNFSENLVFAIRTVLSLQNMIAFETSTSFEQLQNIKEFLKNEVSL